MPTLSQVVNAGYTIGSNIMGLFGSNNDWKNQAAFNAALNYKYSLKSAKEMPSATRQGLESAGYNPMLALGNVGGPAQIGNVTGATTSYDANSKINNSLKFSEIMNNVKAVKSQADLNNQQIKNLDVESYGKAIENFWKPSLLESQTNAQNAIAGLNVAQRIGQMIENGWIDRKNSAMVQKLTSSAYRDVIEAGTSQTNAQTARMNTLGQLDYWSQSIGISKQLLVNTINKTDAEIRLMNKQGKLTDEQARNLINVRHNRNYQSFLNTVNTAGNIYGVATGNPPSMGYQSNNIGFY